MSKTRIILISSISLIVLLFVFVGYKANRIISLNRAKFNIGIDNNIIYTDIEKEYGIVLDSFNVESKKIKWNQNLASILDSYGLNREIVNKATYRSGQVFDIRKIRAGNKFQVFLSKDTNKIAHYFVYQHTPTQFLKINLKEEPVASIFEKEIREVRRVSEGTVESSLWNTMIENDIDPMMAIRLSEIYAWTVDFFGLEKGDHFRVLYDEQYVDSTAIGLGRIYAVDFTHKGETNYAFGFTQDSVFSYFDEEGNSLRRQFLKAPLRFSRISSGYSNRRLHPILKIYRPHRGVDYAAPQGTPVYSIGDGYVVKKSYSKGAGYYVKIKHNSVYTSGYMHFSKYAKGIRQGVKVKQGQVIGYVGKTGYATGPHLDFRIWKNGSLVNPLSIKAPPVEPIKEAYQDEFDRAISNLKADLEASKE